ncbi:MAG: acylneuraminate cytidylyltransferase family protein [Coxiellaceae bacterium]|nr:acylneuraminate cytidylyltransferase family protein [Coxiellaceae bacterium]
MRNRVVAVIPARGGSKGLPRKNVLDFCGKPLLAWSIEQAKEAEHVSSVWVSSDDDEILDVALRYGANSIKRPDNISNDTASSESAWKHAVEYFALHSIEYDALLGLQATSPLRESEDIDHAISIFFKQSYDSLFSAAVLEDFLIWQERSSGELESINYDYKDRGRRQDRHPQLVENGSFYLFLPEVLKKHNNRLGGKIGFSLMDFWKSFEIDNDKDFSLCETLFKERLLQLERVAL